MADWKAALKSIRQELNHQRVVQPKRESVAQASPRPQPSPQAQKREVRIKLSRWLNTPDAPGAPSKTARPHTISEHRGPAIPSTINATSKPAANSAPQHGEILRTPSPVPDRFQPVVAGALLRSHAFKAPDDWVTAGQFTQLAPESVSRPTDIVVGLDFGTSFTKAAIRIKDQVFAVSWDGTSHWPDRYLLPSEFTINDNGACQLGQARKARPNQVRQGLKQAFFDPEISLQSMESAALFVALVLRYVRAWAFHYHSGKIGSNRIRWMLNIGAPSNGLENQRLEMAYKKLGYAAWAISVEPGDVRLQMAKVLLDATGEDTNSTDLIDLHMIPEFVAQIAGYVQSARRRPGLHALVDIGGGTLDIVTFMIHQIDGEDVFPFLIPEVKPLGTQMLNLNRWVDAPVQKSDAHPDELAPVLDASEYAAASGLSLSHVTQRDSMYWAALSGVTHRVLHLTKRRRYRMAPEWKSGLPTFVTGGGASFIEYRSAIQSGATRCAQTINLMQLPLHPRLVEFAGGIDDYQRVSVACGLAQDPFALGRMVPAGQVEDDVPIAELSKDRPGSDDIYSR